MEEAEDSHQEDCTVHARRSAYRDAVTAEREKDLEEDEGLFDEVDPLPGGEGEDMMEKWTAEVPESQFKACRAMTCKEAETWAVRRYQATPSLTRHETGGRYAYLQQFSPLFMLPARDARVGYVPSVPKIERSGVCKPSPTR
jgi:hypothetical protein